MEILLRFVHMWDAKKASQWIINVVTLTEKAVSLVVKMYGNADLHVKANVVYNIATCKYDICFHPNHTPLYPEDCMEVILKHCEQRIEVIIEEP